MDRNRVKEWSYNLFFILMIFAKGIGLDSGDRLYYILSAAACLCVGVKLALTQYEKREAVLMTLLCAVAFLAYWNSGRLGIALSVLTIIGLKGMEVKRLFRLGAAVYGSCFAFTVFAAWTGIIANPLVVHEKGGMELIRWGMGYSTGNVFHVSYFMLAVLLCYTWGKGYGLKQLLGLMAGNFLVYLFSLSYTGVLVTAFYLFLNLYAVKRKAPGKAEKAICLLPLPFCLLFSFGAPYLLQLPAVQKLDRLLQARLSFSAYYLQNQPITLFGARMKDVPNFWVIMDNGYVYILMTFGVAAFALFCWGYGAVIRRYAGEGKLQELAIIFSFLIYGIMEQFISNAFMNFSLLFLGEALFGSCCGEKGMEGHAAEVLGKRKETDRKRLYLGEAVLGIAAVCIFGKYYFTEPVKEYICVPLESLNYVRAQSMQIYIGETGTKAGLQEKMEAYGETLETPELAGRAIAMAGMEGRVSEEELAAALEYSIPVRLQQAGEYDTFRVRLLELYCDITEEEYSRLLEHMAALAQEKAEGQYTVKEVCAETVGKSFGEDRIEHMGKGKRYEVEKTGEIAALEHFRASVFYGVFSAAVMTALWRLRMRQGNRRR